MTFFFLKVPGAWLESQIKKVRNDRYCVSRVVSTGSLWVDRDRLRLVKHTITVAGEGLSLPNTETPLTPLVVIHPSSDSRRYSDALRRARRDAGSCNIM